METISMWKRHIAGEMHCVLQSLALLACIAMLFAAGCSNWALTLESEILEPPAVDVGAETAAALPLEGSSVLGGVDLVICLDVTGSMGGEIESLTEQVNTLAEILNKIAPTGIGVIAFGDEEWTQTLYVQDVTTNSEAIREFLAFFTSDADFRDGNNPNPPEAVSVALERAERMNWRPEAEVRHVVVITDNPAMRQSAALAAAARFASAPESHVSAVMVRGGPETREFMQALADSGNGEYVDGNFRTMLGAILLTVL